MGDGGGEGLRVDRGEEDAVVEISEIGKCNELSLSEDMLLLEAGYWDKVSEASACALRGIRHSSLSGSSSFLNIRSWSDHSPSLGSI